jgi:MFS superfamily sulfate permease-like transporter
VIFLPEMLNHIPLATLGSILLMVGYKLSKVSLYKTMYKLGWDQFMPFIATIIGVLMTDLLIGIGIGMVFSIFYILRTNYKHSYAYKKEVSAEGEVVSLRLSQEVTFLNKASIRASLDEVSPNSKVIIDGSQSIEIDHDVLEIIQDFKFHKAPQKNIKVETICIREVVPITH